MYARDHEYAMSVGTVDVETSKASDTEAVTETPADT